MKPQDILLLMKLCVSNRDKWKSTDLAKELGLSQPEVSLATSRCVKSGLLSEDKQKVARRSFFEVLVFGVKYFFPAKIGPMTRGMPTAHSAPPLSGRLTAGGDHCVWPDFQGPIRGQSLKPLYPSVIMAAKKDQELYEALALVDAIRIGRSREVEMAVEELKKKLRL